MANAKSAIPQEALTALSSGCSLLTGAFGVGIFSFIIGLLMQPSLPMLGGILFCGMGTAAASRLSAGLAFLSGEKTDADLSSSVVSRPMPQVQPAPVLRETYIAPKAVQPVPERVKSRAAIAAEEIDWEQWIGKKLLQKVGIAVVLIGIVIFLKYSFDNRWIDELGRIALSTLAAVALLAAGEYYRARYRHWALAFTGGGLALFYFTIWVAHVLYAAPLEALHGIRLTNAVAFPLYALTTIAAVGAAVRYRSQTIAWFALIGGYLTPLLIALPDRPLLLSLYLGILALGILALAWQQKWGHLNLAAFILTQFILGMTLYGSASGDATQTWIACVFFILFFIPSLLSQFHLQQKSEGEDILLLTLNTLVAVAVLLQANGGWNGSYAPIILFGLSVVHAAFAALSIRRLGEDKLFVNVHVVAASALITLGFLQWLDADWVLLGWAPLSVTLLLLAIVSKREVFWYCADVLFVLAGGALLTHLPFNTGEVWRPLLSPWAIQSYVFALTTGAWMVLTPKLPQTFVSSENAKALRSLCHLLLAILLFVWVTFEMTSLRFVPNAVLAFSYLAYGAFAVLAYRMSEEAVWFVAACVANVLVLIFVFLTGDQSGLLIGQGLPPGVSPFFHVWTAVSVFSLLLTAGLIYTPRRRLAADAEQSLRIGLRSIILAQLWLHGTVELMHAANWFQWDPLLAHRVLSGWWMFFALAVLCWGYQRASASWRTVGLVLLTPAFLHDVGLIVTTSDTVYEIGLWSLLSLALLGLGAKLRHDEVRGAGLILLTGIVGADMLAHLGSAAGFVRSVWWAVVALATMGIGFATNDQQCRRAAIAVFAAVTFKLLLIDFAVLSTPVRITASIVTGLLLIGASYLYQRFDEQEVVKNKQ